MTSLSLLWPGSAAYEACLAGLASGAAAADAPALICQPRSEAEVAEAVAFAAGRRLPISVRSGGHSAHCARAGSLVLDLAAHLRSIAVDGEQVDVQGGAAAGPLLQALAAHGRTLPVGTHPTTGFGLLTMGGIGHLSRSLGLSLDAITELRGVRPDGEFFRLSASSHDTEGWRLLRGASLFLAVVTGATLRTFPQKPLRVRRGWFPLDELQQVLLAAEALPASASCSLLLGSSPGRPAPAGLSYAVARSDAEAALGPLPALWSGEAAGQHELPPFEWPDDDGSVGPPPEPAPDRRSRTRVLVFSLSVSRQRAEQLAPALRHAAAQAPSSDCRIDLQHVGGAVADVPALATAYTGRSAEWSVVIAAAWSPRAPQGAQAAQAWAEATLQALLPLASHYYLVQRHPELPVYGKELELAYGPLLERLRARKQRWDPLGLLPSLEAPPRGGQAQGTEQSAGP